MFPLLKQLKDILFGEMKVVTRARHGRVRATVRGIPATGQVLDFASAGMKDLAMYQGRPFTGGDILPYWEHITVTPTKRFVLADLFHNPFACGHYRLVVSTNSIPRLVGSEKDLEVLLGGVMKNVHPHGVFLTNRKPSHPHAAAYKTLIEQSFGQVEEFPVSGLLTYAFDKAVDHMMARSSPATKKVLTRVLAPLSAVLYYGLLRWFDFHRDRYATILVARNPLGAPPAANPGPWGHLKSPMTGGPLHLLEDADRLLAEHGRRLPAEVTGGRTPEAVLSDGEYTYPVVEGVPFLTPQYALPPDEG